MVLINSVKISVLALTMGFLSGLFSPLHAEKIYKRDNPFTLPEGVYHKSNMPQQEVETLELQAVVFSGDRKIATISGFNFEEGQWAFGRKVLQILKDRAILEEDGKRTILHLKLPASPFSVRVDRTRE